MINRQVGPYTIVNRVHRTSQRIFFANPQAVLKFFKNDGEDYKRIIQVYHQLNGLSFLPSILHKIEGVIQGQTGIAFQQAAMGSLYKNIINCKFFPQNVAKYYVKELVQALKKAYEKGFIHSELKQNDILIDSQYNIKIIGWQRYQKISGGSKKTYKDLICSIAQIILFMLIGRPIFLTHSLNDHYYKFVKGKKPQKFWQALQKYLNCSFQEDIKALINDILFEDTIKTFDQILNSKWLSEIQADIPTFFQKVEQKKVSAIQQRSTEIINGYKKMNQEIISLDHRGGQNFKEKLAEYYIKTKLKNSCDIKKPSQEQQWMPIKGHLLFFSAWLRLFIQQNVANLLFKQQQLSQSKVNVSQEQNSVKYAFDYTFATEQQNKAEKNIKFDLNLNFFQKPSENQKKQSNEYYITIKLQNQQQIHRFYQTSLIQKMKNQINVLNNTPFQ